HSIRGIYYNRSRSEFGKILLTVHKDYSIGIKNFAFSVLTLHMCHFFFTGYQPFKLDMILQLGRKEKLWVMEPETQVAGCSGHGNQNEIETLQEAGLRQLLHEGLMCWQIWEQFTSKLTRTQDSMIKLQGKKLPKQDDSSCEAWSGESTQVPEDENYIGKLQGESSTSIKNQESPTQTSWDFWRKMYLRESQNYQ
ncbi:hypothetical protein E2I00_017094, partial [Balaenoptera physalus]